MCTSPSAPGQALAPPPPGSGVGGVPARGREAPILPTLVPAEPRHPPIQSTHSNPQLWPLYHLGTTDRPSLKKVHNLNSIKSIWNGLELCSLLMPPFYKKCTASFHVGLGDKDYEDKEGLGHLYGKSSRQCQECAVGACKDCG